MYKYFLIKSVDANIKIIYLNSLYSLQNLAQKLLDDVERKLKKHKENILLFAKRSARLALCSSFFYVFAHK